MPVGRSRPPLRRGRVGGAVDRSPRVGPHRAGGATRPVIVVPLPGELSVGFALDIRARLGNPDAVVLGVLQRSAGVHPVPACCLGQLRNWSLVRLRALVAGSRTRSRSPFYRWIARPARRTQPRARTSSGRLGADGGSAGVSIDLLELRRPRHEPVQQADLASGAFGGLKLRVRACRRRASGRCR